ncbi:hypothetical protein WN944_009528 [Citrus x changshan-huyou]|uniref:Uncharacterized protein n=1 Tax=Citrus x changshan-huyou TaxID=2935761 RepID=A0AAP0MUP5_9ROSI
MGGILSLLGKLTELKSLDLSSNKNNISFSINHLAPHSSRIRKIVFMFQFVHLESGFAPLWKFAIFPERSREQNNKSRPITSILRDPIPQRPQFDTFQNDSYVGNPKLCGFLLSKSYNIDEAPEPTRFHEEDDASSWFDWKFAKMGYVSGLVIGLLHRTHSICDW